MNEKITLAEIAGMFDHAVLHPTCTDDDLTEGIALARRCRVKALCVKPNDVKVAADSLQGSGIEPCAVVAFPHGTSSTAIKVQEARLALQQGATEIDVVVNVGKVLGGDWSFVSGEIRAVNDTIVDEKGILKLIFETDYLEETHVKKLCDLCSEHRVAFAKTSTGFGFVKQNTGQYAYRGAVEETVALMRKQLAEHVQIKASGGIGTLDALLRFRSLGATRIGASATESILQEARARGIE